MIDIYQYNSTIVSDRPWLQDQQQVTELSDTLLWQAIEVVPKDYW